MTDFTQVWFTGWFHVSFPLDAALQDLLHEFPPNFFWRKLESWGDIEESIGGLFCSLEAFRIPVRALLLWRRFGSIMPMRAACGSASHFAQEAATSLYSTNTGLGNAGPLIDLDRIFGK